MPFNLRTDWKTIGRTGKTVDNREITEEMVKDAVELYDASKYKAFVWPEHARWYKMGGVEAVRLVKNDEGGLDIQAILSPNDYWLYANSVDQKTCTSMELDKLDRFGGRWYLTGLGATDSPASFGTTEIRFSKSTETALRGHPIEFLLDAKPERQNLFSKIFGKKPPVEETEVDEKEFLKQFTALAGQVNTMSADLASLKAAAEKAAAEPGVLAEGVDLKAIEDKIAAFGAQIEKFTTQTGEFGTKLAALDGLGEKFAALDTGLKKLREEFDKAVREPGAGTTLALENLGEGEDLTQYI